MKSFLIFFLVFFSVSCTRPNDSNDRSLFSPHLDFEDDLSRGGDPSFYPSKHSFTFSAVNERFNSNYEIEDILFYFFENDPRKGFFIDYNPEQNDPIKISISAEIIEGEPTTLGEYVWKYRENLSQNYDIIKFETGYSSSVEFEPVGSPDIFNPSEIILEITKINNEGELGGTRTYRALFTYDVSTP